VADTGHYSKNIFTITLMMWRCSRMHGRMR